MKLYYSAQRASDPNSAEPWQIPGKQDKAAERIDVPGSPAELVAWLNDRRVPDVPRDPGYTTELLPNGGLLCRSTTEAESIGAGELEPQPRGPRVYGYCDSCGRSTAGTLKLQQGNDLDEIGRWMETAELWAIQQTVERARDVIRARSAALDGKGVQ